MTMSASRFSRETSYVMPRRCTRSIACWCSARHACSRRMPAAEACSNQSVGDGEGSEMPRIACERKRERKSQWKKGRRWILA